MAVSEYKRSNAGLFTEDTTGGVFLKDFKNKGAMPVFYRNQIKSKK